jgi:hypothetical protein
MCFVGCGQSSTGESPASGVPPVAERDQKLQFQILSNSQGCKDAIPSMLRPVTYTFTAPPGFWCQGVLDGEGNLAIGLVDTGGPYAVRRHILVSNRGRFSAEITSDGQVLAPQPRGFQGLFNDDALGTIVHRTITPDGKSLSQTDMTALPDALLRRGFIVPVPGGGSAAVAESLVTDFGQANPVTDQEFLFAIFDGAGAPLAGPRNLPGQKSDGWLAGYAPVIATPDRHVVVEWGIHFFSKFAWYSVDDLDPAGAWAADAESFVLLHDGKVAAFDANNAKWVVFGRDPPIPTAAPAWLGPWDSGWVKTPNGYAAKISDWTSEDPRKDGVELRSTSGELCAEITNLVSRKGPSRYLSVDVFGTPQLMPGDSSCVQEGCTCTFTWWPPAQAPAMLKSPSRLVPLK